MPVRFYMPSGVANRMDYGPFYEEFPEVAEEETRQINILNEGGKLPKGRYLLMELFCTDPIRSSLKPAVIPSTKSTEGTVIDF